MITPFKKEQWLYTIEESWIVIVMVNIAINYPFHKLSSLPSISLCKYPILLIDLLNVFQHTHEVWILMKLIYYFTYLLQLIFMNKHIEHV